MIMLLISIAAGMIPDASPLPILSPGVDLYPIPALAARESGTSVLTFDIMPSGDAANCNVIQPSGFDDLDKASCSLAIGRQQFAPHPGDDAIQIKEAVRWTPADFGGTAWNGAIPISPENWVTPDDYPATALQARHQGAVQVRFDITETGTPQDCKVVTSSGDADLDAATCRALKDRANLLPAIDPERHPRATHAQLTINWQIPNPPGATHQVVFDVKSAGSVCYARVGNVPRLLTSTFCGSLANAIAASGGGIDGVVDAELPTPIPYAPENLPPASAR